MSYLLDTHIVLWVAREPNKLSTEVIDILENIDNQIYFSSINLWEIALKNSLGKSNFQYDVTKLKSLLLANGFL
nr:PIN domain-containing protein [uncultured Moraxella sp.]